MFAEFASIFGQISEGIDTGTAIDVIYLDLAKSFDKIPHKRLLFKLDKYGIREKLLPWFRCWLSKI